MNWVLSYTCGVNRVITEPITIYIKDSETACFDINEAKKFEILADAVEYLELKEHKTWAWTFKPKKISD